MMTFRFYKYVALLVLMVMIAGLVYQARKYWFDKEEQIQMAASNLTPKSYQRSFKNISFTEIPLADSLNKYHIGPAVINTTPNEIFLLSINEANIKRFDRRGNLLNTIGNGKGRGPGEFFTSQ